MCKPVTRWFWTVILFFMIGSGILVLCVPKSVKAWMPAEDSQAEIMQYHPGFTSKMEKSWQDFLQAYNTRDIQEIDSTLNNLLTARRDVGFANATPYSFALLVLAQDAHDRHDDAGAITLSDQALKLSPGFSFPYQARSQLYFAREQWFSSLKSSLSGLKRVFSNYLERLQLFAGASFVFAFLPLWLFVIVHITLSLKYFRSLRKSWERRFDKKTAAIILFAVLFAANALIYRPTMLLPGLLLLFICFFPFYSFREKFCSFIIMFFLILSPFAYFNGMKIIDNINSPFFQSVMAINFDSYKNEDQQHIFQSPASTAGQRLRFFSQAVIAGKEKRPTAAIAILEQLIRKDPHPTAAIYNNLGNYYYMDNQIEAAISAYRKAIKVDPSSGIYHYNLSHAYIKESFSLNRSEASFIQAWKLSPEIVDRQLEKGQNANEAILVHMPLPWSYTYNFVATHSPTAGLKGDFFRIYFSPRGGTAFYLIFMGIVVFIMSISWIKRDSSGRFCPLCGTWFHGVGRTSAFCPSCLYVSRQSISDSFTTRQRKKIRGFSWLMDGFFFLIGFVVPGTYQLALGQTVRGVLMLCGSFMITGSFFLLHKRIVTIALFPPGSVWGPLVIPLLLLVVFWLVNYYSWRFRQQQRLTPRIKN